MNKLLTIIKKELRRFFFDKRMLFTLIMPGFLIFIVYSLMGNFISDAFTPDDDYTYNVHIVNNQEEYDNFIDNEEYTFNITYIEETNIESSKQEITNKNIDLLIFFDKDFSMQVNQGQTPKISIYYNSSSTESLEIYNYVYSYLMNSSVSVDYKYLVNMEEDSYNLATQEDMSAQVITMMLPFLLIVLLFTGCLAITSESIAGEKERGTINTLLVTPTKRSHIALGKIIALSLTSLVSASASFIGLIGSLPSLLSSTGEGITLQMYNVGTYIALFGVILVTVIFFTTILSLVSTLAKNVKESSQWSSVIMILVMMLGVTSLIGMGDIPSAPYLYLIPVYNSVLCMSSIFSLSVNILNFIITILSNVLYISLGVYLLAKMFNSEKIMSNI